MNRLVRSKAGMTLIEILIVITILLGIMTIVGSRVYKQFGRAKIGTTELKIHQLSQAITEYQMTNRKIPSAGEGLKVLEPDYIDKVPDDGWDHPFRYESPGPNNMPYDIISDGPDGVPNTEDDISLSKIKQ